MTHRLLVALPAVLLLACGQAGEPALQGGDRNQTIDQKFFAAREAICERYSTSDDGYEAVPLEQVKDILQLRHNDERIMAHLSPEHYCVARKVNGERVCYRLNSSAINVGGGVNFCTDRRGNVSDFELEE